MALAERFHFLAHPARIEERATIGNHDERLRPSERAAQRAIQLFARRRLVFAEEHSEVALTQTAREVGRIALRSARRRAERERNEDVVAEESCGVAALRRLSTSRGHGAGQRRVRS